MEEFAVADGFIDCDAAPRQDKNEYYSVEIPISGLGIIYQFKIWEIGLKSMSILIKDNSRILPWIKKGDRLNMKYYSSDFFYPYRTINTEIINITRQERGRLKGHYLVGLKIIESQDKNNIRWLHQSDSAQILPFYNTLRNWRP